MHEKKSKLREVRDRIAEIDAHKASFIAAGISTILDTGICLVATFPHAWLDTHRYFPFISEKENLDEASHSEMVMTTATPAIAVVFSILLMMGNRLKVWVTYPLFLLFNSLLLIWNIIVVFTIYIHAIPEVNKSSTAPQEQIGRKLYLYSFFLIFAILAQFVFNLVVWRGWRVLKASIYD